MAYDWRREQEEANRRHARDAEIAAQQAAHNRKLQENSKKAMDFWANKMGKELEDENRRVIEQKRSQSSSGWGTGTGWGTGSVGVESSPIASRPYAGPERSKEGIVESILDLALEIAESIPPLKWLIVTGKSLFALPGKYYARLAAAGAAIGLVYGIWLGNPRVIPLTIFFGAVAGGLLLGIIGGLLYALAILTALTLLLAAIAAAIGVIYLLVRVINYIRGTS
jgi:hypothetical protein